MSSTAIVILNWNGKKFLEKFLEPLVNNTKLQEGSFTIYVADNGSTDQSLQYINANFPQVKTIAFTDNYGFTGGYNRALSQIEADYYLLLNSDVLVEEDWLQPMVDFMENNQNAGICQPKVLSYYNRDHFEYAGACGGFIDLFGFPFCRGRILSNVETDNSQYDTTSKIFWASGTSLMIRASLYRELGGLDERFFAHMEEIDLCWRAQLYGYEVWAVPASKIYHVGGGTLPNNSPRKLFLNYRNNLYMLYKNLFPAQRKIVIPLRLFIDNLSAIIYKLQGKREYAEAVHNAHKEFKQNKQMVAVTKKDKSIRPYGIYKGSIIVRFFLSLCHLKFSSLTQFKG